MNDILNPYIAGAPVVEASMFFGREDVFNWIERSLTGKFIDNILVLHGQRRVGKTSVLKQIPNFLPDNYALVFFDLQGRTSTTLDRFLWWLASEIVRTVRRDLGATLPKPDRKTFEDTEYLITEFLPNLRPVLGDKVLLLTFDEFDSLDRPEIRETLANPLIAYLRRLIEEDSLNFIFSIGSSGDKLENMQASYTDFFKSALYRKISFLTREDCYRLITRPVEGVIRYDPKAIEKIIQITSGHPYFTQLMCHELFSLCQKTGARKISSGNVEDVLGDVIERGTVNLKFVWDEASDLEKWILAALAHIDNGNAQVLSQTLQAQKVRFSDSDLNSAVIHLQDKDVITQDYQFVIHLMRMWLQANRPMDRVREELVEVNPIANRYIEIGDEYRDLGQTQDAIGSYQQALAVDPDNLKAQLNIGSVHLEQEEYAEAVAAFEMAVKVDDEDVIARTGYCDAQLALGGEAENQGEIDRAIELYQAILVVNPAHADARQRLAGIYQVRAEDLLRAGQDDEALQTFNQALMLMPDDEHLSARYEEVLAEKKAKVIESLLEKAGKAASAEDWTGAISAWESYLALEPEDSAGIQPKIEHAQKYARLDADYEEAQQAIREKRYGQAIELLQGVIAQDPAYKSTSRLLAEAVEANKVKTPIWQRRGVIPVVVGVAVIALGVLFGPQAWETISMAIANFPSTATTATATSATDEGVDQAADQVSASPTSTPASLSEDSLEFLEWMDEIVSTTAPDYVEDFSITNTAWIDHYQSPAYSVMLGELRINDAPSEEVYYNLWRLTEGLNASDFCLKFDFTLIEFGYGSRLILGFRGDERSVYQFELLADGTWTLWGVSETEHQQFSTGQTPGLYLGHTYKIRVSAHGNQMAILLDGDPIVYMEDDTLVEGAMYIELSSYKPVQVSVDNIEFWDLFGNAYLELPVPDPAKDFYTPIREYLTYTIPSFQEDFSNVKPYMSEMNVGFQGLFLQEFVNDGAVHFSAQEEARFEMNFPELQGKNVALQLEFIPQNLSSFDGITVNKFNPSSGSQDGYNFYTTLNFWEIATQNGEPIKDGNLRRYKGFVSPMTLLLIYYDEQFAAFLDGFFLGYLDGLEFADDWIVIGADSKNQIEVSFDNIKFWNLPESELSEMQTDPEDFTQPVLDFLETAEPSFQEDFESPQPYWSEERLGTLGNWVALQAIVQEGAIFLQDDGGDFSGNNIQFDQMSGETGVIQFDFQLLSATDYVSVGINKWRKDVQIPIGYNAEVHVESMQNEGFVRWSLAEDTPEGASVYRNLLEIPVKDSPQGYSTLLFIFDDNQFAAFLDGELIDYLSGMQYSDQDRLWLHTASGNAYQLKIDNIKFWNLDGVQLN